MDEPSPSPITVQKEWITIGSFSFLIAMAEVMAVFYDPADFKRGKSNVFTVAAALLWWLGHGV